MAQKTWKWEERLFQRCWFYFVNTCDFFRMQSVRNENPSLEARIWNSCHFELKFLQNGNPVIGIISSQIVFCNNVIWTTDWVVLLLLLVTTLNWITTCFFRTWTVFLYHEAYPSADYGSLLEFSPRVPRSSFAFFFNPRVSFLPQESSLDHTATMLSNTSKWAPL